MEVFRKLGEGMRNNVEIKGLIIQETKKRIRKNPKLTIKEIADACFVNIAAVNYHFGRKDNLMAIVVKEILDELKENICASLETFTDDYEDNLERIVNILMRFTLENSGVVKYLFLHNASLERCSYLLMDVFFTDNSFTERIINEIKKACKCEGGLVSKGKYLLLFSCLSIPLFLQVAEKYEDKPFFPSFQDSEFLQTYIKEMLRIIR